MKKWIAAILIIVLIIGLATVYIYNRQSEFHTIAATVSTFEDKSTATGFLVKNEMTVSFSEAGVLKEYYYDGQRVAKGALIASVYQNAEDGALITQIQELQERIDAMSKDYGQLTSNDILKIETLLSECVTAIGQAGERGDMKTVIATRENIKTLMSVKHSGNAEAASTAQELETEKATLEGRLSRNKKDIYAPQSGIFVSRLDGYENRITYENMSQITPSMLTDELGREPSRVHETECKVIDNYLWHMVFNVREEQLNGRKAGDNVVLIKKDTGERLDGNIVSISEAEDGLCTVCISSDRYFEDFGKERIFEIELVYNSYTGYVIPARAVHALDGKYGVYIQKTGKVSFREIQIIYQSDEFVVAKNDNSLENGLLLYDNIIIDGDISEFYS